LITAKRRFTRYDLSDGGVRRLADGVVKPLKNKINLQKQKPQQNSLPHPLRNLIHLIQFVTRCRKRKIRLEFKENSVTQRLKTGSKQQKAFSDDR
jgi:c-di-GMP-binding flagellar brake protein YcgR